MLALGAKKGDWCNRSDESLSYFCISEPSNILAAWTNIKYFANPSDFDPSPLGTVFAGNNVTYSRSDHIHPMPSKADIGLENVDNTSDANKPISTATQTALDSKAAGNHTHTASAITDFGTAVRTENVYALSLGAGGTHSPGSGLTYYIAQNFDLAPVSTASLRDFRVPYSGTIVGASITITITSTLASFTDSATVNLYRKSDNSVVGTITSSGVTFNASSQSTTITGLNIPIAANTSYLIQLVMPALGVGPTYPTSVKYNINLWIKGT